MRPQHFIASHGFISFHPLSFYFITVQIVTYPHGFIVVLDDGHFKVETGELAQVSVGVAVLSSEHWPDLEHSMKWKGSE